MIAGRQQERSFVDPAEASLDEHATTQGWGKPG